MATYMLFAETPLTRQRESPNGPNIILSKDTKLGRAASGPGLLPVTWAQVSGVHCRIYLKVRLKSTVRVWCLYILICLPLKLLPCTFVG